MSFRLGLNITTDCFMLSDAVACRAISTLTGADRNVFVILSISGAMVALKKRVCLVKGVNLNMRSMSGMNPMSSILSASSTTITCTPVKSNFPLSKWSISLPGVAIKTSTPLSIRISCSLKLTPPIKSALLNFKFFA